MKCGDFFLFFSVSFVDLFIMHAAQTQRQILPSLTTFYALKSAYSTNVIRPIVGTKRKWN